jgi:hypothetical protein
VDADEVGYWDSVTGLIRKMTWANIKTVLKAYFDVLYVSKTSATGSAILPAGTTAQRDGTPADGYTRFNSTLVALETWYSSAWNTIATTANAVLTTGDQTIAGIKTFSNNLINFSGTTGALQVGGVNALAFNQYGLTTTPITVRQTVELGTVDSNGFAAFGGSTGSTTVTTATTLYLNAANGMVNRRGSITNPSWTGLSTNGTMYAYLDIASDGTCTTGSTTLAPVYQFGGTYSVTSGQFTFNIQEMTGKVGNGATAAQTYRVFVGEVTVAGNVVTAITWYALMGRFVSTAQTIVSATVTTLNHNIGVNPPEVKQTILTCLTAEFNYSIGDKIQMAIGGISLGGDNGLGVSTTNKTLSAITGALASSSFRYINKTTGLNNGLTNAYWNIVYIANRGW